jgi:hypothetical protein
MCGLADFMRPTAPSNGVDAKSSAAVPLSSPAAAQRCAEGAGLDSGAAAEAIGNAHPQQEAWQPELIPHAEGAETAQ